MNLVSVIIPTFNRALYLRDAIDSVLGQTVRDYEILVVDDSSTDNTRDLILSYKDKVRYICQEHKERAAARNRGIREARGHYIAFLDSDDMWLPTHLEECLKSLCKSPTSGLCYSGSYISDQNSDIMGRMDCRFFNGYALDYIVRNFSSGGCNASSCVVRKEIFDLVGHFNEDQTLSGSEDWEMWVRLASHTDFVSTNTYTVKVRVHNDRSSSNVVQMANSMKNALDTVYGNSEIAHRISKFKNHAYSSMYVIFAVNYYALGDMVTARRHLRTAVEYYPPALFTNKKLIYTFIRTLLGSNLSFFMRKMKWRLGKIYFHT